MLGNSAYEVNRYNYMKHTPAHKFRFRASMTVITLGWLYCIPYVYYLKWKEPGKEEQERLEKEKIRKDKQKLRKILYEDRHLYSKEVNIKQQK